jgi:protein-L-isoaspartate(D-aspartate) O-methyltransferase
MGRPEQELYAELRRRGIPDEIVAAMARVPRELFAPSGFGDRAYANEPLPLPAGQTISQPYVVGRMCELLELTGKESILDVGTGSGWHAAVLAQLGGRVVSIERHAALARLAERNLAAARARNVTVVVGDGTRGFAIGAPFHAINVAAASRDAVPAALLEQLAVGGRLVAPVDDRLVLVRRTAEGLEQAAHDGVRFVPLVAANGDAA